MREINAVTKTAVSGSHIDLVYLVAIHWPDGWVRLHTGLGPLIYAGDEYQGIGAMGSVGDITDNAELGRHECSLTLSGLDDAAVAEVIEKECFGRTGNVYLGFLDENSRIVDTAVLPLFAGEIDKLGVEKGENNKISITLTADNLERSLRLPDRYNDESHQKRSVGDRFFRYITAMVERPIYWGNKKNALPLKEK